jgi:hypothetical protein
MSERKGRTVRLGDVVGGLVRPSDRRGGLLKARAAEMWPEIAGPEIAKHTVGMGVRSGELNVHVDSHAWATQLALLAEELRGRLNSALGEEAVRSIRFTVSRAVGDARTGEDAEANARRRYGGERVEPEPLSEAEVRQIAEEARGIENEALREAAIRARMRDREVKKAREARKSSQGPSGGATGGKKPLLP